MRKRDCFLVQWIGEKVSNTVDGRNPAPFDMVNIPLFTRLYTSQAVQDFFHQQYASLFCGIEIWTLSIGSAPYFAFVLHPLKLWLP